jgi:O-antigen/teichoic acid export membrane protein
MIVARKIAYNVLASSVSKILSTVLALVSIGLVTRYLGKEGFGNYATALAFLSFFSAIADLGLNSASTREISRPQADEKKIMGNIFFLRIVVSFLVFVLSPIIVCFFPYPPEVKRAIIIVAASFLFSSSYQILNGVFQKNLAMDKVAFAELMGKILQVAVIYFAIRWKLSFTWIMSSLFFYMVLSFAIVYFWSKKYLRFKMQLDWEYWKKFLKSSYPIGLGVFITFIYFKLDTILLSVMKTSADVGLYGAAYKIIENITFFPSMIVGLVFPIMAGSIFYNFENFRKVSDKTYKFFWIFIIPLVIGTLFFADEIIEIIGGAGFSESALVLKILIFALVFIFFGNFFNAILIAGNQQKKLMLILSVAAIFNVVFNLIFIGKYSYLGASIASVLTEMIVTAGTFYFVYKKIKYFPRLEKIYSIIFSGVVMAIVFFLFKQLNFFLIAPIGVIIYLTALWIFGAVKTHEISGILIGKKSVQEYGEIS